MSQAGITDSGKDAIHPPMPGIPSGPKEGGARFGKDNKAAETPNSTAEQLLSEVAHDLRSPLMAIRESILLINDGKLGQVTDRQHKMLDDSIRCCGEMEQLIDNMLQLDRLRSGMPRVRRLWIDPIEVLESIATTLNFVSCDQRISLVSDFPRSSSLVYADADKLRRLLANLLVNAFRVTPTGGQVLLGAELRNEQGKMRFSVIDRGCGMNRATLRRLSQRGASTAGGHGLGLVISRQMASLHFGFLEVTSQEDQGTRVSFELPAAGPLSVIDSWIQWREAFCQTKELGTVNEIRSDGPQVELPIPNLSGGVETNDTVFLTHDGPSPQNTDLVSVLSLKIQNKISAELADQIDINLQANLRMYELAYRVGGQTWVLLWDTNYDRVLERISTTEASLESIAMELKMHWTEAVALPVGTSSSRAQLRDLLVRNSLSVNDEKTRETGLRQPDSHSPRIGKSDIASRRLDEELRHLSKRIESQRERLLRQASALRVPVVGKQ